MGNRALFGLFGAGGHGRDTMPIVRASLTNILPLSVNGIEIVFVEEVVRVPLVNGYRVLSEEDFFSTAAASLYFNIAIASGRTRERISGLCAQRSATAVSIIAGNAIVHPDSSIGQGAILSPFTMVSSNIKIGKFFQANMYSYVAHDCTIGDFVTFAPMVKCNGNVCIGDFAFIGSGAVLRDGSSRRPLRIGAGAVVGMGAVVTQDVDDGVTVVGNPARIVQGRARG